MQIEIDTSSVPLIDWGATGISAVVQNVSNLLNTYKYEVAYDRLLGMNGDFVDGPMEEAVARLTSDIYDVIETSEPRANVEEVAFIGVSEEGTMIFKVVIDV